MSLPANWATVTVTGTYLNIDGEPLKGTVTFSSPTRLLNAGANVTVPEGAYQVRVDNAGSFSVVLPATDDPDVAPSFYYEVVEDLILPTGRRSLTTYLIQLPAASPTVDLADVVPVTAVAEVSPYLRAASNLADVTSVSAARSSLGLGAARRSSLLPPVRPPAPLMITAFQSGHGWTVASAASSNLNDTSDYVLGSQAVSLVTNTAAGTATLDSPTLTSVNLTGMLPRILVKVEGQANQTTLRFFAGDSTFTNYRNWNFGAPEAAPTATFIKEGEWTWVTLNWLHAPVTGTDPRAAVTRFRLSAQSTSGTSMTVHVGAVTFVPEQSRWPNGVVSICFDDGRASPFVNAKPKLDALGWAATEYPIVDKVAPATGGTYATLAQLQQAYRYSGWEMGVHASTGARHDAGLDALTPAELENEIAACQDWLAANNLGNGEGIAWPLGRSTRAHEEAAAKLCGYGRGNVTTTRETWPPPLPMRVRSAAVSNSSSLALIQSYVDEAKATRSWLCLTFHEITTPGTATLEWPTASFASLMDYIKTQGCAVLPAGDVLRNAGTTT